MRGREVGRGEGGRGEENEMHIIQSQLPRIRCSQPPPPPPPTSPSPHFIFYLFDAMMLLSMTTWNSMVHGKATIILLAVQHFLENSEIICKSFLSSGTNHRFTVNG